MSLRRLAVTVAAMATVAALLAAISPGLSDVAATLRDPQASVEAAGPESLVLAAAALLAWLAWGWGALGLLLTALTAVPGTVGALARSTGRLLLSTDARRAAAALLGLGLAVGAPALSACSAGPQPAAATAATPLLPSVPDWPTAPSPVPPSPVRAPVPGGAAAAPVGPPPVPEWPAGGHVVVRGDSLWRIAATDLRARTGRQPATSEVADAVGAWWSANADVVGPDPDLLFPGQVLRAPAPPSHPRESESHP